MAPGSSGSFAASIGCELAAMYIARCSYASPLGHGMQRTLGVIAWCGMSVH